MINGAQTRFVDISIGLILAQICDFLTQFKHGKNVILWLTDRIHNNMYSFYPDHDCMKRLEDPFCQTTTRQKVFYTQHHNS